MSLSCLGLSLSLIGLSIYRTVPISYQAITVSWGHFAIVSSRGIYSLYRSNTNEYGLGKDIKRQTDEFNRLSPSYILALLV